LKVFKSRSVFLEEEILPISLAYDIEFLFLTVFPTDLRIA
jgi:hypothetical protein